MESTPTGTGTTTTIDDTSDADLSDGRDRLLPLGPPTRCTCGRPERRKSQPVVWRRARGELSIGNSEPTFDDRPHTEPGYDGVDETVNPPPQSPGP